MMKPLLSLFIFISAMVLVSAQQAESLFIEGNIHFAKEEFAEAKSAYLKAMESEESSHLHFNLGNTYWKLNETPQAIFHYLNAILLDPNNDAARSNLLNVARIIELDTSLVPPQSVFLFFSESTWLWIATTLFWGIVASLLYRKWKGNSPLLLKLVQLMALGLFCFSIISLYQFDQYKSLAINLTPSAELKIAPAPNSPTQTEITNFSLLKILQKQESFTYLEMPNGTRGYLPNNEILSIR